MELSLSGGCLPLGFRAANSGLTVHLCQSLSAKRLSPAAQHTGEKMLPILTEIIWADRNSIGEENGVTKSIHELYEWISFLALSLRLHPGGHCSQTEMLNGTDVSLQTTANSLSLMRSWLEAWHIKENSLIPSNSCEFYHVPCGTLQGNNVNKLGK